MSEALGEASSAPKSRLLRVVSKCSTPEEFVALFRRFCDGDSIFIVTRGPRAVGTVQPFAVTLADGKPMLYGRGEVMESYTEPGGAYQRAGMRIKFQTLDSSSRKIIEQMRAQNAAEAAQRLAAATADEDEPTAIKGSKAEAGARSKTTQLVPPPPAVKFAPRPKKTLGTAPAGKQNKTLMMGSPLLKPKAADLAATPPKGTPQSALTALATSPDANLKATQRMGTPLPGVETKPEQPQTKTERPETKTDDDEETNVALPHLEDTGVDKAADGQTTGVSVEHDADEAMNRRTTGSFYVVPANPFGELSDQSLEAFVECTLYEESGKIPAFEELERLSEGGEAPLWSEDLTDDDAQPASPPPPALAGPTITDTSAPDEQVDLLATLPPKEGRAAGAAIIAAVIASAASLILAYVLWGQGDDKPTASESTVAPVATTETTPPDITPPDNPADRTDQPDQPTTAHTPPGVPADNVLPTTPDDTSGETPPGETPPGETPPGETPPGEAPPGEAPPGETPPGETPPGETPPGETPHGTAHESPPETPGDVPGSTGEPSPPDTPVDPSVLAGDMCELRIATSSQNARVWLNGTLIGRTPLEHTARCGEATLTIKHPRYVDVERTIKLRPGDDNQINIRLIRPQHTLKITSKPTGAVVSIRGRVLGNTPLTTTLDGFTRYPISVALFGYMKATKEVYSTRPQTTVRFKLTKIKPFRNRE